MAMKTLLLAALVAQTPVLEPRLQLAWEGSLPALPEVSVFVQSYEPALTAARLRGLGGSVGTVSGDVLTARLPLGALDELSRGDEVLRIEEGRSVRGRLDEARAYAGVDKVAQGVEPLTSAFDGAGVVVGVADRGLDWAHPAFEGRVAGLWDHGGAGGGPKGYGSLCTASETGAGGGCAHTSDQAHGTHVASIAVGGAEPYPGVATGADLMFVNLGTDPPGKSGDEAKTTAVCDAVDWVFGEAGAKPAVVNLSLGSHEGPHDGSSLASKCLDGLTGPGRIIVAAAGNEAAGGVHAATGDDVMLHVSGQGTGAVERADFRVNPDVDAQVVVWLPAGATAQLVVGFGDQRSDPIDGSKDSVDAPLPDGSGADVTVILLGTDASDGQRRLEAYIVGGDGDAAVRGGLQWFAEVISDKPWDGYLDVVEGHGFVDGAGLSPDGRSSIGFPAAARSVIAVGAHKVRLTWPTAAGGEQSVTGSAGQLSAFSGRGPSRDEAVSGTKPDIAAPGEMVIAALSQHATDAPADHVVKAAPGGWAAFAGTSMASPFVAGVVALMLQADGQLGPSQVRTILRETASTDGIGQTLPDSGWGYGRLDAAAAVARVEAGDLPAGGGGDVPGGDPEADDEAGGGLCAASVAAASASATPRWAALLRR